MSMVGKFNMQMHIAQGDHNRRLAMDLWKAGSGCKDWCITIAYYSALHYVEFWLKTELRFDSSTKSRPHTERNHKVSEHLSADTARSYKKLYNLSNTLRYISSGGEMAASVAGEWLSHEAVGTAIERDLDKVITEITDRLKKGVQEDQPQ